VSFAPSTHYDRVTEAWDLMLGDEFHVGVFEEGTEDLRAATNRLTDLMIEGAQIGPDDHLLDVGCGTGGPAARVARETGARVTGISTSAEGIQAATRRAEDEGLADRLTFEVRDGMDNGFPDGSFSRSWALESSLLMPDRSRLVSELARVLPPGGHLAMCDFMLIRPLDLREVRSLRRELTVLRDVYGDVRMEPLDEYRRLAEEHGLQVDRADDLTAATRRTFEHWRQNAERTREPVSELVGEEYWRKFAESCEVLGRLWDDGLWGYGLLAASKPTDG
jgi:cyclopropane fatty-acyl-phospholipid synthase-like methyltransferase